MVCADDAFIDHDVCLLVETLENAQFINVITTIIILYRRKSLQTSINPAVEMSSINTRLCTFRKITGRNPHRFTLMHCSANFACFDDELEAPLSKIKLLRTTSP